jgi:hypothetical protein
MNGTPFAVPFGRLAFSFWLLFFDLRQQERIANRQPPKTILGG